jgi:hypothetical protein
VNFKDEPEILQTPIQTSLINKPIGLKSSMKKKLKLQVEKLTDYPKFEEMNVPMARRLIDLWIRLLHFYLLLNLQR